MRLRRMVAALAAGGTIAALPAGPPATAGAAPAVPPAVAGAASAARPVGEPVAVTLITGDRVVITAGGALSVLRAPGREGVRFISREARGHRYVIPADALPLIRDGRLDRRLFDLTALREFGYTGDADLPLLVAYPRNNRKARPALGRTARVTRDLPDAAVLAVRAPLAARGELWTSLTTGTRAGHALRPGVERILLDGKRRVSLDVSVPQIGAPAAWQRGLDGTGVTVAVLDTGIDATHPDFAGRIVANENFTDDPDGDDLIGHGTHVASIIAGSGARSGGRYRGVAPGAKLAVGKVCGTTYCDESAILAGMAWAARTAPVVNMSLGGTDEPGLDPLEQAVEDLTAAYGALFVIAAGNSGSGDHTIESPGSADAALTVGAVDDGDRLAGFSSRGPRTGDDAIKPDITAPGVDIVAARAAHGELPDPDGDGYVGLNGTSMATPHVAGAAAILTQQHPGWSPRQRKTVLTGAATPAGGASVFGQGAGRVDVARTVSQAVSADEGSLSFGVQQWPHEDDTPITRTLTYRNGGTEPVTLALALDGDTEPFVLGATTVTVPAGGTATTTVTADTRRDGPFGFRTGRVVATGDGVTVRTPVAVNREAEVYDVTLRHVGRDGGGATDYLTALSDLATGLPRDLFGGPATTTMRLPKGVYGAFSLIGGEADTTMLVQPKLVVDGPVTVNLDARRGRPVDIRVPAADAEQVLVAANAAWVTETYGVNVTAVSAEPGDTLIAQVGGPGDPALFAGSINSVFARGDGRGGFFDSPYTYEATYQRRGTFFTGLAKRLRPADMARVRADYGAEAAGAAIYGVKWNRPSSNGAPVVTSGVPFHTPIRRTEWLNTDGGISWYGEFVQINWPTGSFPDFLSSSVGPEVRLRPGRVYRQEWNRAPFAPSAAADPEASRRAGDRIVAAVPMLADADGHLTRSRLTGARTALYSGGTLIGENAGTSGDFAVPAGSAAYRLESSVTRGAPYRLSTAVSGSWTFTSAAGEHRLPLSTVRFDPRLTGENAAPAGPFAVPVTVERAPGSAAGPNRQLAAEFSTDDGRSWQPARVTGSGDRRVIHVTNPDTPGAMSLRVHAIDAAGNTATITVVRAYAVG